MQELLFPQTAAAGYSSPPFAGLPKSCPDASMIYDIGVLIFLVIITIRGAAKGMAWQLAAIASLVLCFLFATPFSLAVAPLIKVDPPLNRWIAMLVIYLGFSFVCFGAARAFRSWVEAAKFVEYDRHLGAIFGLLKGVLAVFVVTFFLVGLSEKSLAFVMSTKTGYASAFVMQKLRPVMPAEILAIVGPYLKKIPLPAEYEDDAQFAGERHNDASEQGSPRNKYRPINEPRKPNRQTPADRAAPRDAQARGAPESSELDPVGDIVDQVSGFMQKKVRESVDQALDDVLPAGDDVPPPRLQTPDRKARVSSDSGPIGNKELPEVEDAVRPLLPTRAEDNPPAPRPRKTPNRTALVEQIAGVYYASVETRRELTAEVEQALEGVPPSAAAGALEDWYADLMGQPDPDPETNLETHLDQRIARQLSRAGIPLTELPPALRGRIERR